MLPMENVLRTHLGNTEEQRLDLNNDNEPCHMRKY
jgi:hypothetical protein